jgi:hypothetical protein
MSYWKASPIKQSKEIGTDLYFRSPAGVSVWLKIGEREFVDLETGERRTSWAVGMEPIPLSPFDVVSIKMEGENGEGSKKYLHSVEVEFNRRKATFPEWIDVPVGVPVVRCYDGEETDHDPDYDPDVHYKETLLKTNRKGDCLRFTVNGNFASDADQVEKLQKGFNAAGFEPVEMSLAWKSGEYGSFLEVSGDKSKPKKSKK